MRRQPASGGSGCAAPRSAASSCGLVSGRAVCGVAAAGRIPSSRIRRWRRQASGAISEVASKTGANDHIATERSPIVKSSRNAPCSRARSTSRFEQRHGSACGARRRCRSPLAWRRNIARSGRFLAWSSSTCSRKPVSPAQASSTAADSSAQPDDLADVLGVDRLDQRVARRKVTVERPDPNSSAARDLLERLPLGRARRRPRGPPRSGVICF